MDRRRPGLLLLLALLVAVCVLALGLAACGGSDDGGGSTSEAETTAAETTETTETTAGGDDLAAAEKQLEEGYAGRYTEPPTASNPAAKGKTVWFISPGQASPNAAYGWKSFEEAAKEIGW